jgi:hypothetical protein
LHLLKSTQNFKEAIMTASLGSEDIVDVIEATVRVLVATGLSREQALQVMLSQIAVQLPPDVMKLAVKVSEKYADAFTHADWDAENMQKIAKCGSSEHPFAQL